MQGAGQSWSPIQEQYDAPEAPTVISALDTPQSHASELSEAGSSAYSALSSYASRLEDLRARRQRLLDDIADFEAEGADGEDGEDDDDRQAREDEITGLQQRCHDLAAEKDEAQNTCANALGGITTSAGAARGSEHRVPVAGEADDIADPSGGAWETVDDWTGATPGDGFGNGADPALWGAGHAMTVAGASSTFMSHQLSRTAPRQNWAPSIVRHAAGNGNGMRAGMVAAVTGWDARRVTNGGHFLGKNDPRNPYRSSGGAAGTMRDVGRRTLANMNSNNRVATSGNGQSHGRWQTAGKWATRAGGAATAATSFAGSWNEDSANHPDMGVTEKGARATTVAAGTTAGAAAGAKGGAAVGAAVGSVVPGVGTAAGAIVGGVVGGVVGGGVGAEIGESAKETVGNVAEGAKDLASDAWDGVTSLF